MPDRAKVTSLEALETFRAKLIVYREKAGRVLDEVSDNVTRTRLWLETERPAYWQNQLRQLSRELERAQQELFSAQLSGLRDASVNQQVAVQKLRRAIRAAEDKTKTVKQWQRQYDTRVEMPARQAEKLRHFLEHDLGKAVNFLNETIKHIAAYTELSLSGAASIALASPKGGEGRGEEVTIAPAIPKSNSDQIPPPRSGGERGEASAPVSATKLSPPGETSS
jgi:acyl transferase domain-containing protein